MKFSGVSLLVVEVSRADVAELADATDLGSVARQGVEVRVLSSALAGGQARARGLAGRRLLCKEKIVRSNTTGSTLCKVQSPVRYRPPSRVVTICKQA